MEPSLPVQSSTLSFWHRTTRAFPHLHSNRLVNVPISAKYLIIGSGVSGALTAWMLIERGVKGEDIVVLEAREAVSGASGRNAGHIRPDAFPGFSGYAAVHGPDQAKKILENERLVMENVRKFVEANDVDCDFNYTTILETCFSKDIADRLAKALLAFKVAGGDVSHVRFYEGEQAKSKTRHPAALCAYEWPAASNHPAKLIQWILNSFITKGGKLWTHCPATKIVKHLGPTSNGLQWDVHTPRGIIAAETVIHCTNAYAAYLVPQLRQFIRPCRSQSHSFIPRLSQSGENTLKHTMSLRYGDDDFFSVNPLRNGAIIFGGTGFRSRSDNHAKSCRDPITFDDAKYSEHIAANSKREFSGLLQEPLTVPLRHGEGLDHVWTRIMGMTPDHVPLIGPIEGLKGQWISAGFNGMAWIFRCAPALVELIFGTPWKETGLPECFQYSRERVNGFTRQQARCSL